MQLQLFGRFWFIAVAVVIFFILAICFPNSAEPPLLRQTVSTSTKFILKDHPVLDGVYVREAFRDRDDQITIFLLHDTRANFSIEITVGGTTYSLRNQPCIQDTCIDAPLFNQCSIKNHYSTVNFPPETLTTDVIYLRVKEGIDHVIKVIDVREKGTFEHNLAVVHKPVWYGTDWQNFIQFFESYLAQGATKFYIHHYAWTPQVEAVIQFYKSQLGDGLEVVPWAPLPIRDNEVGNFLKDPNTRWFDLATDMSYNSALYRAKGTARYLAVVDLDESIWINDEADNMVQLLDRLATENPKAGQFFFKWFHVGATIPLEYFNTPSNIDFIYLQRLQKAKYEALGPEYWISGKTVYNTSRAYQIDYHHTLRNFNIPGTNETYSTYTINETQAKCLHIRRIYKEPNMLESEIQTFYTDHSNRMLMNFKNRIQEKAFANYTMVPFLEEMLVTMRTFADCARVRLAYQIFEGTVPITRCGSTRACEPFLENKANFVFPKSYWTNIAAKFHTLEDIFPLKT